jgi:hypothetical protein
MKTSIVCVAVFMLFMALGPAQAQRCPAGHDAFLNCLPLDHRYGGPGQIQRRTGPLPANINPATGRPYDATNYDQRYEAIVTSGEHPW